MGESPFSEITTFKNQEATAFLDIIIERVLAIGVSTIQTSQICGSIPFIYILGCCLLWIFPVFSISLTK